MSRGARELRLLRPSLSVLITAGLALVAPAACADEVVMHPGAQGPEVVGGGAGAEQDIRLLDAHVDIRFGRSLTTLTTRFVFRSAKPGTLKRQLGFPDLAAARDEAARRAPGSIPGPTITGAMPGTQTLVNDWPAETKRQVGIAVRTPKGQSWRPGTAENGPPMAWDVVSVEFPAGKDVTVERRYQVRNGRHGAETAFFEYLVHTAGPWQGPIGRWVVDVILADGLTVDDLTWAHTKPGRSEWRVTSPTHMRLDWRDFEPAPEGARSAFKLAAPAATDPPSAR
jgi:hypothetical protein